MSFGTILTMAGGLGLFLFGMELMSDSIEKVAGARLRRILEIFTTNRFMGMIVGIIFTGIIQSSSACTVMVVSFVNSGLMICIRQRESSSVPISVPPLLHSWYHLICPR